MTSAPGIVTSGTKTFEKLILGYPSVVRELSLAARGLIYDALPGAVEVVWPQQHQSGYGTGPNRMTDQFAWLAPQKQHLVFGFYYGTELPDPGSLLEGHGSLLRHAKIRTMADLRDPSLRSTLQAAVTHRVSPLPLGL